MSQIACLRCKQQIAAESDQCPNCGERVTLFQRTYASRLIDGKYQILDRLGVGGMGEIFKVRHIHLNELRVIKIMRPNVAADDQGMQRFLQEARTSTMIKHKNLAMLYDFAQLEDGSYYMVWEFIDGTNIQKWISQNGPVPPRLAVEISMQALNGLEHLHSMGLIHRDISPENIMLSQDRQGKLAVKVIDFGIAKQLGESEGGQGLTQTGMFLGKLKYASPEQAGFLKEGEHLDPRSDLYSFGIVMYEMLAGKAPFQATNPHGYILKHVTEKPAPIAATNPEVKVPSQLEAIIMRSLEKSRDARYATAAEFEHGLEAVRNTIPPDTKFGLGERMITLSGAQTLADLPKVTAASFTSPSQTKSAADEATIMERGLTPTQQTMVGKTVGVGPTGTRSAADEATIMENLGAAAPTSVEQKWGPQAAEPTVIERKFAPEAAKKSNTAMIASIAAVVVLALAVGAFVMYKKQTPSAVATNVPSAAQLTTTAAAPIASGKGQLLLSAAPWGNIEKIIGPDQKSISLSDDETSTPRRLDLPPGSYKVTLAGPEGPKTVDVNIEAGKKTRQNVDMAAIDVDTLTKEIGQ
ncbi:MAG TPA: serine/threonine-protein kinase [Thermoanaerobaculia bacterium]|jgi:serine/threonine-protein kinase